MLVLDWLEQKPPVKQDWAWIEDQSYALQLYGIDNSVVDPPNASMARILADKCSKNIGAF